MTLASSVLLTAIPLLVSFYAEKYRIADLEKAFPDNPQDFSLPVAEKFDYIIIGGGTAGCILANRLSEKYTVLLVEAGGNPPPIQNVPMLWNLTRELPLINFLYKSIPQINGSRSILDGSVGKMMGGSSSHNGLTYERGHPEDYNRWAEVTGDPSWSYENVLKYFKKSETYGGKLNLNESYHGDDGPVTTREDDFSPGREAWLEAGREMGYQTVDSNGPEPIGFSKTIFAKRNGKRESSYTAYIQPIEGSRKNLKIYRYSYVSQILFEEKTAIGIRFTRHGIPRIALASKEVILSAGCIMSPLILIKSGIGPLDQLQEAKIDPISVLPVGHNLMDHPVVELTPIHLNRPDYSWNMEANLTFQDVDDYVTNQTGPLASAYQGSAAAFIVSTRNQNTEGRQNWPDLQIYYAYVSRPQHFSTIPMAVAMNHPVSRGRVRLNVSATSMDDDNLPLIDFNFFDDESDLDGVVEAINFTLNVLENTKVFQNLGARYGGMHLEECQNLLFRSTEYWKCYAKNTARSAWHVTGTCRMGRGENDELAVVDSKLRVIGVKKLRVVDASIMPYITSANTFSAVVMLAEKAADDILNGVNRKGEKKSEL